MTATNSDAGALPARIPALPLRVGVVGLGAWGAEHLRAWSAMPGVKVAALCSRDVARAASLAAEFAVEAIFQHPDEMAQKAELDAVCIVNDEAARVAATLPFVRAGVHVLVEKPIALTITDAEMLVEEARRANVIFLPGHILRFDSRLAALRERIVAGQLGRVRSVYARRLIPVGRHAKYSRHHPALMAAIHDIDLARWFFDAEPAEVRAYHASPSVGEGPDVFWAMLEFPGDRIAVIENAWVLPDQSGIWLEAETEVIGSQGVARVRLPGDTFELHLRTGSERPDVATVNYPLSQPMGALMDQLTYFAKCVSDGRHPDRVSGADGTESVRAALAAVEAAETGLRVDVASVGH